MTSPELPLSGRKRRPGGGSHRRRILAGALLTLLGAVAVSPVHASAHAVLVRSQPSDGAQLGLAPGAVVLDFSDALNPRLSDASVSDPDGRSTDARPIAPAEIRVDLITNVPGRYLVRWTAVSNDDGHTTSGRFAFTVDARGGGATVAGGGPSSGDVALAIARWVEDGALLVAVGMLLIGWLGRREPPLDWVRPRLRAPLVAAFIAGCTVITAEALVATGGNPSAALGYFGAGVTGMARLVRVALELAAVLAVSRRARYVWPTLLAALVALAASGHAAANTPQWWGLSVDSGHLVAAGAWAGGIMAMTTLRPPGGWRRGGVALLSRFTPWALASFTITIALGVVQSLSNVGTVSALTGTAYGRVLLAKATAVLLMIPLSLLAWRLRRPRLRIEGSLALAVVAAAALLASFPVPSRLQATSAGQPGANAGLPQGAQLTLADHAGEVLVGITVTPALPGPNDVSVYVLPWDGAVAAAGLEVSAAVDHSTVRLQGCGDTCRRTSLHLVGHESVTVAVAGATGGVAHFRIPSLPTSDARSLLRTALARMSALHSYAMHETLTGGGATTVTSDYTAIAPDRFAWTETNGSGTVSIGTNRYERQQAGAPWVLEAGSLVIPEPYFVWQTFSPYRGERDLGTQTIDGTATTIVGFFGSLPGTPVWFRLWIDRTGLVHRAEMRAQGHFMDESFRDFDGPLTIAAPSTG
ncbi:MAG: copper resistance protein CopC [Candidatus Dormibacter sp.]